MNKSNFSIKSLNKLEMKDGFAMNCDLCYNGERILACFDNGDGSEMFYHEYKNGVFEQIEKFCKSQPNIEQDYDGIGFEYKIDFLVDELIETHQQESWEKKKARAMERGICYGEPDAFLVKAWKNRTLVEMLEESPETVKQAVYELRARGEKILNSNLQNI